MLKRNLSRENFKRIHDSACSDWKPKLVDWFGSQFALNENIDLKESLYKQMRLACTTQQNQLFDEIFGKGIEQLTIGKWYKSDHCVVNKSSIFITNIENHEDGKRIYFYGIGIDGQWTDEDWWSNEECIESLVKMSNEEIQVILIKEAKKRDFKNGCNVHLTDRKIVRTKPLEFNRLRFWMSGEFNYLTDGCGGSIYENGEWGKVIEQINYKRGDRLKINGEKYIISSVNSSLDSNQLVLINLSDGIPFIAEDINNISHKGLSKHIGRGYSFTKIIFLKIVTGHYF